MAEHLVRSFRQCEDDPIRRRCASAARHPHARRQGRGERRTGELDGYRPDGPRLGRGQAAGGHARQVAVAAARAGRGKGPGRGLRVAPVPRGDHVLPDADGADADPQADREPGPRTAGPVGQRPVQLGHLAGDPAAERHDGRQAAARDVRAPPAGGAVRPGKGPGRAEERGRRPDLRGRAQGPAGEAEGVAGGDQGPVAGQRHARVGGRAERRQPPDDGHHRAADAAPLAGHLIEFKYASRSAMAGTSICFSSPSGM